MEQYGQLVARFLKETNSPFAPLDPEPLLRLASRLKPLAVPAGTTIVRQGEHAEEEACYLLGDGSAEVLVRQEDTDEERH